MYIVSYDIASDRLRTRIAKILEGYGKRVQYSIFECDLTGKRYAELYRTLFELAGNLEDGSIYFYYVCRDCENKKRVIGDSERKSGYPDDDIIII